MKILLNIATHGDEKIGLKVAKEIEKLKINKNILAVQIANKKAFKLNKRFIDQDLNRSFPGKKDGNYEEKLANRLSSVIKSVDIVVDVHSTKSNLKDTIIITKLSSGTKKCIEAIGPKYVLLMNATKNSALISSAKIGIAFEYGKDNDITAIEKTVLGIKRLLNYFNVIDVKLAKTKVVTQYFNVTSTVLRPKGFKLNKSIKNYKMVSRGTILASRKNDNIVVKEDFYPILFGENSYKDYFGFKGERLFPK